MENITRTKQAPLPNVIAELIHSQEKDVEFLEKIDGEKNKITITRNAAKAYESALTCLVPHHKIQVYNLPAQVQLELTTSIYHYLVKKNTNRLDSETDLSNELNEAKEEIDRLTQKISELAAYQGQVQELNLKVNLENKAKTEANAEINKLNKQIESSSTKTSSHEAALSRSAVKISDLEKNVALVQKENDEMMLKNKMLVQQVKDLEKNKS